MVLEVSVVKKMLCGVYDKPKSKNSQWQPPHFWSRGMPAKTKNYIPFEKKNSGMLLGPSREEK